MGKPRHHILDVYDAHLHVACDRKGYASLRRSFDWVPKKAQAAGTTNSALWVPKTAGVSTFHVAFWIDLAAHKDNPTALVNTCAHEATHGAARILEHIGQPIADDEAMSYLVGWLTGWLWDTARS